MSELAWLERWYQSRCNGSWEHIYGVKIDTLDNPGWRVEIDGLTSNIHPKHFADDQSEVMWVKCSFESGSFKGYGGTLSLERIIRVFRDWMENETGEIDPLSDQLY
jgi:hypothetical protein